LDVIDIVIQIYRNIHYQLAGGSIAVVYTSCDYPVAGRLPVSQAASLNIDAAQSAPLK
jgi:hypothetical protein